MLVEFPEGKTIIQEGGFSNDFYAIESRVRPASSAPARRSPRSVPGDVFGEQGLLEKQERSASVVATSPLRALKIENWEIPRMRKAMPEVLESSRRPSKSDPS